MTLGNLTPMNRGGTSALNVRGEWPSKRHPCRIAAVHAKRAGKRENWWTWRI